MSDDRRRKIRYPGTKHLAALVAGVFLIVLPAMGSSLTANMPMAPALLHRELIPVTPDSLKPDECDGFQVTNLVTGSGTITGSIDGDLILASGGDDIIDGGGGPDCIVDGAGLDQIDGGGDNDVCIGTSFTVFTRCEVEIRH